MRQAIPRDRLPRIRFADLERLSKIMGLLTAAHQAIARSKVTGSEAITRLLDDAYDLARELGTPAQHAIKRWIEAHPQATLEVMEAIETPPSDAPAPIVPGRGEV